MTKNEEDAADIVQETMLTIFRKICDVRNGLTLAAFINKTAIRICLRILQKKGPIRMDDEAEQALLNEPELNADFIPEEFTESKERRELVVRLVDELNIAQRAVIVLFYYQQLPIRKIAELLDIEEGAVKMRLTRAKAKLRSSLESYVNPQQGKKMPH
jgi:RNA polymerase sigma factor (sigma-70 family)